LVRPLNRLLPPRVRTRLVLLPNPLRRLLLIHLGCPPNRLLRPLVEIRLALLPNLPRRPPPIRLVLLLNLPRRLSVPTHPVPRRPTTVICSMAWIRSEPQ
jgi:hypothetical protein